MCRKVDYGKVAEAFGWSITPDSQSDEGCYLLSPDNKVKWEGDKYSCEMKLKEEGEGIMNPPPAPQAAGLVWSDISGSVYRAYAASTGNKNYQGLPMPAFEDLPLPIKTAWEAAVRHTHNVLKYNRITPEDEQYWAEWKKP